MANVDQWEHLFKPDVRKKGALYFQRESVTFRGASDTEISAFVKAGSGCRVSLKAERIEDPDFFISCSCPAGLKNRLCAHEWATLLAAYVRNPDFFDSKENLMVREEAISSEPKTSVENTRQSKTADAFKQKQTDFRKQQYQKQKQHLKDKKQALKKNTLLQPVFSPVVQKAVDYFLENGFPLATPIDESQLKNAKKKLARIFHPDLGGTHEETVALNHHYDVMLQFIGGKTL